MPPAELGARKCLTAGCRLHYTHKAGVRPAFVIDFVTILEIVRYIENELRATGVLGRWGWDAETAAVQVVVEVDGGIAQVHHAALVDDDRHAMKFEGLVELRIHRRVEIELVLKAAATAAHDAHAQIDLLGRGLSGGGLLFGQNAPDFTSCFFGYDNSHRLPFHLTSRPCSVDILGRICTPATHYIARCAMGLFRQSVGESRPGPIRCRFRMEACPSRGHRPG